MTLVVHEVIILLYLHHMYYVMVVMAIELRRDLSEVMNWTSLRKLEENGQNLLLLAFSFHQEPSKYSFIHPLILLYPVRTL